MHTLPRPGFRPNDRQDSLLFTQCIGQTIRWW